MEDSEKGSRIEGVADAWTRATIAAGAATLFSAGALPCAYPVVATLTIGFGLYAMKINRSIRKSKYQNPKP